MAATKFTVFLAVLLLSVGCVYGDDQPSDMRLYTYSSDSILLIWDSPTHTNHKFDNYRLNISGGQQRSLLVGTIGWMVVEHLKPSTNYTMTLEARYAKNKIFGKPAQATATTFAKGTDMPRDLTAEVISGTAVKLTWKPPVNTCPVNKVYVVEVGRRTYDVDYDEFTGTYTVNGLARGHKYKISVSVFYEFPGYSAPAARTTVTTPSRTNDQPSDMRLYTYSSDSILLIWDSPTDTHHKFDNYRLNISGGQQRSLLVGTIGWMVIERLQPSTTYTMTLEARYAKNEIFGKPAQATAVTFGKGTDMPRDLTAEVISGTAVKLTWKPPVNTCPVDKVYVVEVGRRTYDVDYDEFTGTYTVNGLARGHKYKISVSVFYEFPGYSAPAARTTVTTPSRKLKLPSN